MNEGSLILDKSRLVVVICFLLKYYRVKKTYRTVLHSIVIGVSKGETEKMGQKEYWKEGSMNFHKIIPPIMRVSQDFPQIPKTHRFKDFGTLLEG